MISHLQQADEYRDYLARHAEVDPACAPPLLTFQEFGSALERWTREYHMAWSENNGAHMRYLETLLLVSASDQTQQLARRVSATATLAVPRKERSHA